MKTIHYLALFLIASSSHASAASNNTKSILDRLEEKLLERDRQMLGFDGQNTPNKSKTPRISSTLNIPNQVIKPQIEGEKTLRQLRDATNLIAAQVEGLSTRVTKLKSELVKTQSHKHNISLNFRLAAEDTVLNQLSVHLNGFEIYSHDNYYAQTLPTSQSFPVFSGPIRPGNHSIKVMARIASGKNSIERLTDSNLFSINDQFKFRITQKDDFRNLEILIQKDGSDLNTSKLLVKEMKQ